MTNKEAINNLNFIKDYYKDLDNYTINQLRNLNLSLSRDEIEALDKAIKSLEVWEKVKKEIENKYDLDNCYYKTKDKNNCDGCFGYSICIKELFEMINKCTEGVIDD